MGAARAGGRPRQEPWPYPMKHPCDFSGTGADTGTFTGESAGVLTALRADAKHAGHEPDLSHVAA
jgi:hypothetical protein